MSALPEEAGLGDRYVFEGGQLGLWPTVSAHLVLGFTMDFEPLLRPHQSTCWGLIPSERTDPGRNDRVAQTIRRKSQYFHTPTRVPSLSIVPHHAVEQHV